MKKTLSSTIAIALISSTISAIAAAYDPFARRAEAAPTSLRVVVSLGTGTYSDGSNAPGYNFTFRGASSRYGGDYRRVFVRVFDEKGTPVDATSISATVQEDGTNIALSRKALGRYEGVYRFPNLVGSAGPTTKTIVATASAGAATGSGSATVSIEPWGCINCHGGAYVYPPYSTNPIRAIDGVPPEAWMQTGCSGCHAGAYKMQEWMVYMGSVNWPYHAVDRDAWDAEPRPENAVLGFGTHAHFNDGHWSKSCTDCHQRYDRWMSAGKPHSSTGCAGCHGSLALNPPSGNEGAYALDSSIGGPLRAVNSEQQITRWYAINVPANAATVDVTVSWPGGDDIDIYLYGPGVHSYGPQEATHRSWEDSFMGATAANPETISVPTGGKSGIWLLNLDYYTYSQPYVEPLEPGDPIPPNLPVTIRANYPITEADIKYPTCSNCHLGAPDWGVDGTAITHRFATGGGPGTDCRSCHTDPHNMSVPANLCQRCHFESPAGHPVSGSAYSSMTYDECGGCHGTNFHEMSEPLGSGPNCVSCHGMGGGAPRHIDASAFSSSAHALLNAGAINLTGDPLNSACWACHGDGAQPSGHPPTYKNPKICEDCHTGSAAFGAKTINSHRYGSATAEVRQTVSSLRPITGSCLFCHGPSTGAISQNEDPDSGSFDSDGDGARGGTSSAYHYAVKPNVDSKNCATCHKDAVEGQRWGGAIQFEDIPQHTTYYQRNRSGAGGFSSLASFRILQGGSQETSTSPYDGSTIWLYKDNYDSSFKQEGGYRPVESITECSECHGTSGGESFHDPISSWVPGPHGGYDTGTNKCKTCHAVHRAGGAYYLLRADSQDDACSYCHIGGSAHSAKVVYTLNPAGIYTTNGHTMGAQSLIPDSSVDQDLETVTLYTTDESGTTVSEDIKVRRYDNKKNKMFRFARHHGQSPAGTDRSGYMRIGPLALRCLNCHQPHNATDLVWRPTNIFDNTQKTSYKLLRKSPSGSIFGGISGDGRYDNGMVNWTQFDDYDTTGFVNSSNIITVPEETMTAANTGKDASSGSTDPSFPNTIYTAYEGVTDPAHLHGPDRDPQTINQFALSAWCADCHNLNIGYWKHLEVVELGSRTHSDRTHPAPYSGAYNGPGQCYSCHRNDLPRVPSTSYYNTGRASCDQCHFGTGTYAVTIAAAGSGQDSGYDFPHSGQTNSIKLLGNYSNVPGSTTVVDATITASNIDAVCIRCHPGIGIRH